MKKLLISLLCVIMVVCFMPTMAFATVTDGTGATDGAGATENGTAEDDGSTETTTPADPAPAANVAKIGATEYPTLASAAKEAISGNTINLIADVTDAGAIKLPAGVTLDGTNADGGIYTISGNSSISINAGGGTINNVGFENIHNNTPATKADCEKYHCEGKIGTLSAIYAPNLTGEATITGCTFDNIDWDAIQITPDGATAKIIISGNMFKHTDTTTHQIRYIHLEGTKSKTGATVNVTDNQFYDTDNSNTSSIENIASWFIVEDNLSLCGNWFESPEHNVIGISKNPSAGLIYKLYPARMKAEDDVDNLLPIANIGSNIYMSMQAAADAAVQDGKNTSIYLISDSTSGFTVPSSTSSSSETVFTSGHILSGDLINHGVFTFGNGDGENKTNITNYGTIWLTSDNSTSCTINNMSSGTLKITGGGVYHTGNITNNGGTVIISGGTFDEKPNPDWFATGYKAGAQGDGTYKPVLMEDNEAVAAGCVARDYGAKSSSRRYYKSLKEGYEKKWKLYLVTDREEDVKRDARVDLYCEDSTFTGRIICPGSPITIGTGTAELTHITASKLVVGDSSKEATVVLKDGTAGNIEVKKNANLTIEDGTYSGVLKLTSGGKGSITIKGGTYTATPLIDESGPDNIAITGGTFNDKNAEKFVPEGYRFIDNKDGTYTVSCGNHTASQEWKSNETQHWHECANCKWEMTDTLADHTFQWVVDKNATSTQKGSKHEECTCGYKKEAVEIPATGVSIPTAPSTPADNVTNQPGTQGTGTTEATAPTTTADMSSTTTVKTESKVDAATGETKNVVTSTTTVDNTTAEKIVDKAVANKSEEVIIDTTTSTSASAEAAQVGIPTATLEAISEKTEADVTVKTDVAEVKMDNKTAGEIAEQATGITVHIVAEKTKEEATKVEFELKVVDSNGTVISDFNGGNVSVTVKVPTVMKDKKLVCVYIDDNGKYSKVSGAKNNDGTYTFITGHFSAYAIMTEEEADAAIGAQVEELVKGLDDIDIVARSVRTSKGNVKVTLKVDKEGQALIDEIKEAGYTVKYHFYRSTKKSAGYVSKMLKGTKTYTNTYGKKGTVYYYKARVQVYDAEGKLIAKTALKDCKYASRLWKK